MIPVAEALNHVKTNLKTLEAEEVILEDCLGRVLAEDAASNLSHPPVAVSSMDGYAVQAQDVADVPATLNVIGESQAGGGYDGVVGAGQAVRIFTGAPLPDGADAIVIQENTESSEGVVKVLESVESGVFIRPAGLDFSEGDVLLTAATVLTSRHIGLAAAMNLPSLKVRRKPRIAIMATGDEVVMPGQPVGPSQIISSNTFSLVTFVRAMGGEPVNVGIASDTMESLNETLDKALGCDLLVTIGGASVGDYDLVGTLLDDNGLERIFYKIAMRPGKPLLFGKLGGRFGDMGVLGMPGNPVSTAVCSVLFLRPAIMALLGLDATEDTQTARLGCDLKPNDMRQDYLRASLESVDGGLVATPFNKQDSAMQARMAVADCLIIRAPEAPAAKAGDVVSILRLGGALVSV
ncbi:MAG: molybdopterin molybdotransferase MoeA [Alphaproteobacteria bacterium]|jgi:molybdopterin molybdotransferase|nr:molybdopterin molybdotransferase MoeA [Alphaproteobacteria bacterium]MBT4220545.1 molybdopterin molybdotransferase MoeA [Rhodospirillaceae bacterium]MBT5308968.1 molybdopterin molybdotransferase MoeA [Rhodospirillaceae bacterium]MBT7355069.1 molybdopterin molybdotransferase MoeA [Rhodospirillaceae bacterium]